MSVTDRTSRTNIEPFTGFITAYNGQDIDYAENITYIGTVNLPEGTSENVYLHRPFSQPWRSPLKVHALAVGTPILGHRMGESLIWGPLGTEVPDYGPCQ